jgi:predicted transcriptional regulator of viral defense system
MEEWTFLSNHAHVLVCLARDRGLRLRDIAQLVGITERSASKIVSDLEAAGYLDRIKVGRRNTYVLHTERPLRHPLEASVHVKHLLEIMMPPAGTAIETGRASL